MAQRNIKVG